MASSNLDRLLHEIRSNEPSRTSILEEDYHDQSGCGGFLGTALQRNTFVSEIDLRVYALVSTKTHDLIWNDDDPDTATTRDKLASIDLALLLDYLRGPIVKKIKLTSGLNQDLDPPLDNSAVLGVLLPAIAKNSSPLEIDCELYVPPSTLAQFVRDARMSLVRFHLNIASCSYSDSDEYDRPQDGETDRANVADAFKDNESLEYLHLYGISRFSDIDQDPNDYQMDLVERLLTQLGTHPSLETTLRMTNQRTMIFYSYLISEMRRSRAAKSHSTRFSGKTCRCDINSLNSNLLLGIIRNRIFLVTKRRCTSLGVTVKPPAPSLSTFHIVSSIGLLSLSLEKQLLLCTMEEWSSTNQAPTNADEFADACDALRRNDATVDRFTNRNSFDRHGYSTRDTLNGYGRPLGEALLQGNNHVVTLLDLDLSTFLTQLEKDDFQAGRGDIHTNIHPFLQWIRQARNLKTVKLCTGGSLQNENGNANHAIMVQLLEHILLAMGQNPSISEFESSSRIFQTVNYAAYFASARESLTSVKLVLTVPNQRSQHDDDATEATARALGAITKLQVFHLQTNNPAPFLQHLQATTTLREIFWAVISRLGSILPEVTSLCNIWRNNSSQLESVGLTGLFLDQACWRIIESALRATNSIEHFKLWDCVFLDRVAPRLLRAFFKSDDASVQPVRYLEVDSTPLVAYHSRRPEDDRQGELTADMLCGSCLHHFALTVNGDESRALRRIHVPGFFTTLRENASQVRLQLLRLTGADNAVMNCLSTFLPTTPSRIVCQSWWIPRRLVHWVGYSRYLPFQRARKQQSTLGHDRGPSR